LLLSVVLCAALPAGADIVQTLYDRLEGGARLRADRLEVGGKTVRWGDLLYWIREGAGGTLPPPQAVRLTNGEAWHVQILGLSAKKLQVRSLLFGKREIDRGLIAALEFLPGLARETNLKVNTLYREKGEPIPGSLLWIDEQRIAIDSPLGVLTLQREGTTRYLFTQSSSAAGQAAEEEVCLVDGSILRGRVKPGERRVELEHAVLGRLSLPVAALRSILRRPPSVLYLVELPMESVETFPLVASGARPEKVAYPARRELGGRSKARWLRGIRILPKTTVRYRLPKGRGRKLLFRTILGPISGSAGDVRLRITAEGRSVFDRELTAAEKREALSLKLPEGAELRLEVDFGSRIRFPCGVTLGEPHLVPTR